MALEIKEIAERKFTFKKNGETITLEDPNPSFTPEEVLQHYANQYPELTTATFEPPKIEGNSSVFSICTTVGTKG